MDERGAASRIVSIRPTPESSGADGPHEATRLVAFEMEGNEHSSPPQLALHTIPPEDPLVYDMICEADTLGVFQIESRAQMSMLPRLKPRCFYDLVIEVSIVRPGPIQGDMVHPYLRRRNGEEPVTYPSAAVEEVLGKTLGVPLFQEQAMALSMVAAGFAAGEADRLRRAMAAWKRKENLIQQFGEKLIQGMIERGYEREFAERCFRQIQGFSLYGFPESHAASFALLVYASCWIKCHHPAVFAMALLNSQPMGFYAPAQIVRDAEEHGVEVRAIDVNHSGWDCSLEEATRWRDEETEWGNRRRTQMNTDLRNLPNGIHHGDTEDTEGGKRRRDEETERRNVGASGRAERLAATRACEGSALEDDRARRENSPEMLWWSRRFKGYESATDARDDGGATRMSPPDAPNDESPRHHRQRGESWTGRPSPWVLRLGLRLVKGLEQTEAEQIAAAVEQHGPFDSILALWRASGVRVATLKRLAAADAFRSLGLDRQSAQWHVRSLRDDPLPLFEAAWENGSVERQAATDEEAHDGDAAGTAFQPDHREPNLPALSLPQEIVRDYRTTNLTLRGHPLQFLRDELEAEGYTPAIALQDEVSWPNGRQIRMAGIVLVRQRPGTASGILFMTMEDETGHANLIVRPKVYERYRLAARHGIAVGVEGRVERQGRVIHIMTHRLVSLDDRLRTVMTRPIEHRSRDFH